MDIYRLMTTFVRTVRTGNFSAAARDLGITPQAASSHIRQLEGWLGVRLFNRNTRTVRLTDEGQRFYHTCAGAIDGIERDVQNLRYESGDVSGTVRIAAPHGLGWQYVAPALAKVGARYPELEIDLVIQNKSPDLVTEGIDIGVLSDPLPDTQLIARKFGTVRLMLCASPEYLERHPSPRTITEIADHKCIGQRNLIDGKVFPWMFRVDDSIVKVPFQTRFVTNDGDTVLHAALAGLGSGFITSR
jgi:LysR family transcriptional regulator for bpeEF and oprC